MSLFYQRLPTSVDVLGLSRAGDIVHSTTTMAGTTMRRRNTIHRLLIAVLAITGTIPPLFAQAQNGSTPDSTDTTKVERPGVDPRLLTRVVPAVGMAAAGAFLGGLVGLAGGPEPAVLGMVVGGTLGSALGAAGPKGRGLCTENQRLRLALAGATLAAAATVRIAWNEPNRVPIVATIPIGSVMFMTRC